MQPVRGESCPSGQRRSPDAPGEEKFPSSGQKPSHSSTTPTTRERNRRFYPVDTAPQGVITPTPLRHCLWAEAHVASARRELPLWPTRGSPAPGRVKLPSTKTFRISTTPTRRGRNRRSPGSIPPRRVCKPQPHWVIADGLGLMQPARGESCPSGQRRSSAAPEEDKFPSPGQKPFYFPTTPTTRGRHRRSPGSIPPRKV